MFHVKNTLENIRDIQRLINPDFGKRYQDILIRSDKLLSKHNNELAKKCQTKVKEKETYNEIDFPVKVIDFLINKTNEIGKTALLNAVNGEKKNLIKNELTDSIMVNELAVLMKYLNIQKDIIIEIDAFIYPIYTLAIEKSPKNNYLLTINNFIEELKMIGNYCNKSYKLIESIYPKDAKPNMDEIQKIEIQLKLDQSSHLLDSLLSNFNVNIE